MEKSGRNPGDEASSEAIASAAAKLGVGSNELAVRLAGGRIADLIVELRGLRHLLPHHSRGRIEQLLREVGALGD